MQLSLIQTTSFFVCRTTLKLSPPHWQPFCPKLRLANFCESRANYFCNQLHCSYEQSISFYPQRFAYHPFSHCTYYGCLKKRPINLRPVKSCFMYYKHWIMSTHTKLTLNKVSASSSTLYVVHTLIILTWRGLLTIT